MIYILISGPKGSSKRKLAQVLLKKLSGWGFTSARVFTTDQPITIPAEASEERA